MSATLGELMLLQNYTLGTSETQLYSDPMRKSAINRALKTITMMYDLDEYIQESTLVFVAGVASIPTDCLRPNLLTSPTNYTQTYQLVDFETYLQHRYYTYKISYVAASSVKKAYIWPQDSLSLTFTYVQAPEVLVNSTDTIRLSSHWDQGIAELSAAILLRQSRDYDIAQDKDASAKKMLDDAFQNDRPGLQGRELQRLQSIYERNAMFPDSYFNNFSVTNNVDSMTWLTITADVQGLPNYGYFTSGTGTRSITLPASADINVGDLISIAYDATGWIVLQNALQTIVFGTSTTTAGPSGYIASTAAGDVVNMIYRGSNVYEILSAVGNITIV